jgi:hypothetical protein
MFLGSRARPARKADNLPAICEPIVENVGFSKSHNRMGPASYGDSFIFSYYYYYYYYYCYIIIVR